MTYVIAIRYLGFLDHLGKPGPLNIARRFASKSRAAKAAKEEEAYKVVSLRDARWLQANKGIRHWITPK